MTITIKVKEERPEEEEAIKVTVDEPQPEEVKEGPTPIKMKLDIRRAIDGTVMIMDHHEMDITVNPSTNKVVVFPKSSYSDEVYAAKSRLFEHLVKAGIISPDSVQGGNVHGALEGMFLEAQSPDFPTADLSILSIGKFIENERPEYDFQRAYEEEVEDMYIEPTEEESTELGEVPQAAKKGSIQPYDVRRYLSGMYQ